jgi:uncharacterized membrane protein YfcA
LPLNMAVGAVSGLLKGSTGMSGPPVILYLLAGPEAAKTHRANLILFFSVISLISVFPPLFLGLFDLAVLTRAVVLLPILAICARIGAQLFHVVPQSWYRRFALIVLLGAGSIALLL